MKNVILIMIIALTVVIQGCKKDGSKPQTTSNISKPVTINQSLSGKWYFVKDTVQATDFNTRIVFPQNYFFIGKFDYIEFTADSTAQINEQIGHDALMTNFIKFYVNPDHPDAFPPFIYKYKASAADSSLLLLNSNNTGIGYSIKKLTADSMVLYTRTEITEYPHDYRFAQYIRFSR
ncbi:hypothetical protein [Mucilaginibacter polytrichastri]|uniref:Uncharacterized protein n=1 Tax=Mucilaginibacter polytrichastri TaxID=1302689 RepID=A0A1Q5ZY91_9SPHI|nr:hypothetical protein [Mucilaginibacter polytrichastri]OKS86726.1 hypothetical protein RG47T_2183 [Mucilaginibacter polytrichastri]SFS82774.1 hypothetical protein SAMN04487890_104291 [Mucilaginibacter polytrichastri]